MEHGMESLIRPSEIEEEATRYIDIANNVVGMAFVALSLGSLGTDKPQLTAILLIPVAIALLKYMFTYYPKSIRQLEMMLKDHRYENDKQEIKKIIEQLKKTHFNYKSIFRANILYIYGTLSYFILLFPPFADSIKHGGWLQNLMSLASRAFG